MHNIQFNLSKAKEKVVYDVCRLVRAAEMNAKTLASLRFIFFFLFLSIVILGIWRFGNEIVVIRDKKEKVLLWHCKGRPTNKQNLIVCHSSNERLTTATLHIEVNKRNAFICSVRRLNQQNLPFHKN